MKLRLGHKEREFMIGALVLSIFIICLLGITVLDITVYGENHTNGTTKTYVNVTNTEPRIYRIVVSPDPITLSPGNTTTVNCTAYVFDWNGWQDVNNGTKNASFYDVGSGTYDYATADDNNYHYTNASCGNCVDLADPDGTNASCSCLFQVQYYANDTIWQCNFSVLDRGGAYWNNVTRRRKQLSNWSAENATIEPLIAINVPQEIDYGELAVTENSSMQVANLTNYGNIHLNVSVEGWGGDNETQGQNLSMICRRATDGQNVANISIDWERYSLLSYTNFSNMTNLTSNPIGIANLTLNQRMNDSNIVFGEDRNATYWRIYIPPGVTGFCNGTIRFTARPIPDENVSVGY